jgi:small subunit ribosomal protein S2
MVDIKDLLKAGVHFGHKTSRWSPKMNPFIWGSKNKIHLIDIAKTSFLLERAGNYLKNIASQGKSILFIGTKKAAQKSVLDIATKLKQPYVTNRWIGGTLTNFDQVKKAITRLLHLQDVIKKPTEHYKKKELSMLQKEVERLEKNIGGILNLGFPPGAIVVVDAKKEASSIREALNANVPVVSMVDTNTDPAGINFVIPSNDDSPRSITFILEYLGAMIEEGQKTYEKNKKAAKVDQKEIAEKAKAAAKKTIDKKETAPKVEPKKEINDKASDKKEVSAKELAPKQPAEKKETAPKETAPKKTTEKKVTTPKTVTAKKTVAAKTVNKKVLAKKTVKK